MYLLDTNIVSDVERRLLKPTAWLASIDPDSISLSVITIGEIERAIVKLRKVDPERGTRLDLWLRELRRDNADRILAVTEEVALAWGRISAGRTRGSADTLIAATALVHDLILVTRNVADFNDTGVTVLNPWAI
ncbi:type II toxin-antitoxin system VapC family toxin [Mesorhizobium mediterraneum]|uniref:Ribonuclease VapC n=1 Tax=Mesorhizobium mediterraneum TaxID=43617 RepID=A0AB36R4P7_9HYPH|nr:MULTISPECIES: type II toxin-antitoxin system VapC family toxin [Mesorhizobium]RWN41416.1 MAG: type II toxin-antitoxin system VapC family toxin [Mesorhizobium sp.]PAP99696.1 VapC toxin family PIN domain ribonuclease [Mesorhizobium mediterraneum]RUU33535.1 type II toxin-antitoxin system VapC family toxin [Mesorhizobium sp. M6A.T.Ce.TU.002.03.1.1]TIU15860.1 MAG: type II toxin-antitoxin system VapC family toxin [Mesorhizobium sp.]WIW54693.1 type II toxin-antitoxin system VapC family toxin [Meso